MQKHKVGLTGEALKGKNNNNSYVPNPPRTPPSQASLHFLHFGSETQMGSGSHFRLMTLHPPHFFADAYTFLSTENPKKESPTTFRLEKHTIHDVVESEISINLWYNVNLGWIYATFNDRSRHAFSHKQTKVASCYGFRRPLANGYSK